MGTTAVRASTALWVVSAVIVTIVCTAILTAAWRTEAATSTTESTYVSTAGCRLLDTRPGADNVGAKSSALGPGEVIEIQIRGSQGQCTGELAVSDDAVGVALNATAVGATTQTNLRFFPADLDSVPLVSNLNPAPDAPPTPNKVDVQLSPDGAIKVFNANGSVHLVLDVVGHYTATGIDEIGHRLDALENETGLDTFIMAHGYGPTFPNSADPATISHFSDRVRIAAPPGDLRAAELPLVAPRRIEGDPYRLRYVRFCADPNPGGSIDRVEIHGWNQPALGQLPDDPAELLAVNDTGVSSPRCFSVEVPGTQFYETYNVTVWVEENFSAGTDGVDFYLAESGW